MLCVSKEMDSIRPGVGTANTLSTPIHYLAKLLHLFIVYWKKIPDGTGYE